MKGFTAVRRTALAMAITFSLSAAAGDNVFSGSGPDGGRADLVVIDDNDASIAYARGSGSGLFRSLDSGATWAPFAVDHPNINAASISDIALDANTPGTIFVVDNSNDVFRSTDNGATWDALSSALPGFNSLFYLYIDKAQAGVVFVFNSSQLFRSSDNGDTWADVSATLSGTPISTIMQSPSDPSVYFATSWDGVHRSTDGGVTWEARSGNLPRNASNYVFAGVGLVDPVDPDVALIMVANQGVWRTTDAGTSWQDYGTDPTNDFFREMLRDPGDPNRIYLATGNNDVVMSDNGGLSWFVYNNDGLGNYTINDIALDPTDSTRLLIATSNKGIFVSEDRAVSWGDSTAGFANDNVRSLDIDPDTGKIYAGVQGGASFSSDDGASWTPNTGDYDLASYAMQVDPLVPERALAGSSCCGVYETLDGGDTWTRINLQLPGVVATWVTDIDIPETDTDMVLFTDYNRGLFKTIDAGTTWQHLTPGLEPFFSGNVVLEAADAANSQTDVIYVGSSDFSSGGVFKSVDAGVTWSRMSGDGVPGPTRTFSVAVHPENPDIVFAGSNSLWSSTDGGASWDAVSTGAGGAIHRVHFDKDDPDLMYLATQSRWLARSVNGGANWTALQVDSVSSNLNEMTVDPNNRARVLLGFNNAGYREYTYATDLSLTDDTGDLMAQVGETVTLDATVSNVGPRTANRVVVRRAVTSGLVIESASASTGSCSIDGDEAICELGNLLDGNSATVSLDVRMDVADSYVVDGVVSAFEADIDASNATLSTGIDGGAAVDTDGDGVADSLDNCIDVMNASQVDSNGDGYGNACDADLNNDCIVNVVDLGILRSEFFGTNPDADFNSDGIVNVVDLGLLRSLFFAPPGPAAAGNCPE